MTVQLEVMVYREGDLQPLEGIWRVPITLSFLPPAGLRMNLGTPRISARLAALLSDEEKASLSEIEHVFIDLEEGVYFASEDLYKVDATWTIPAFMSWETATLALRCHGGYDQVELVEAMVQHIKANESPPPN